MTDTIRAALDAAAFALRDAAGDASLGNMDAAAAVAAFLKALPPGMIRWGTDASGYDTHNKPTLRRLAAAVEAAAKEAGDG